MAKNILKQYMAEDINLMHKFKNFFRYSRVYLLALILIMSSMLLSGCNKNNIIPSTLAEIIKRDKIIVGVRDDAAPFGFRDKSGKLIGYDVDLAKIIAKSLLGDENKIELVPVTASNRIMKLNSGEMDILVAAMSITQQRAMLLDFSMPYYLAGQAILVNADCKKSKLMDFKGEKLIIVFGSTSEENLRINVPEVTIIGFKTYKEAYKAFKEGRAEGIIADDTILMSFAHNDDTVKLLPTRYSREPYSVAFRKEFASKELIEKIDYIIEYLNKSGKSAQMRKKWDIE